MILKEIEIVKYKFSLRDWFRYMHESESNGRITVRALEYYNDIINKNHKGCYVIFDNHGGLLYDIIKVENKNRAEEFIKHIGEHLVYGTVINGIEKVSGHEITSPNYVISKTIEQLRLNKLVDDNKNNFFKIDSYDIMKSHFKGLSETVKILKISIDKQCTVLSNGEIYDKTINLYDLLLIEN